MRITLDTTRSQGNAGESMGQPPYGYMKDPDNPKHWIVDDEAAQLEREEILPPRAYWLKRASSVPEKASSSPPTKWNSSTITKILSLRPCKMRDEELDGLLERIYEDNVSGKLSDDRFAKMSRRYEDEQKEISEKIKTLRAEMDKLSSKSVTADMFISTVRKYTRAKVLTPRMLNELIDKIEVHQAEKRGRIWEQHLVIHGGCVGAILIPDVFPFPAPQVSVNTKKGVVVNCAPVRLAV